MDRADKNVLVALGLAALSALVFRRQIARAVRRQSVRLRSARNELGLTLPTRRFVPSRIPPRTTPIIPTARMTFPAIPVTTTQKYSAKGPSKAGIPSKRPSFPSVKTPPPPTTPPPTTPSDVVGEGKTSTTVQMCGKCPRCGAQTAKATSTVAPQPNAFMTGLGLLESFKELRAVVFGATKPFIKSGRTFNFPGASSSPNCVCPVCGWPGPDKRIGTSVTGATCPKCGSAMVRESPAGKLSFEWKCPKCDATTDGGGAGDGESTTDKICPTCGNTIPAGDTVCPVCEKKPPTVNVCTKCGKTIPTGQTICPYCSSTDTTTTTTTTLPGGTTTIVMPGGGGGGGAYPAYIPGGGGGGAPSESEEKPKEESEDEEGEEEGDGEGDGEEGEGEEGEEGEGEEGEKDEGEGGEEDAPVPEPEDEDSAPEDEAPQPDLDGLGDLDDEVASDICDDIESGTGHGSRTRRW